MQCKKAGIGFVPFFHAVKSPLHTGGIAVKSAPSFWQAEDILPDASVEERALTFMSAMTKSKGISEAAIREMERMLEQRRKEIRQEKVEQKKKE